MDIPDDKKCVLTYSQSFTIRENEYSIITEDIFKSVEMCLSSEEYQHVIIRKSINRINGYLV